MSQDPLIGKQLGSYQLVKRIGHGGMGMVYEAVHTQLHVSYAIKILHPTLTQDELMVARLRREATVALQLQHENIVRMLDYGWDQDLGFYLVMELLRGQDLGAILQTEKVLPILFTAEIVYQICSALALAHQRGIIHRDLKPPNIFLMHSNQPVTKVKLLDFGIARLLGDGHQTQLTRAGKSFGTPEYMPPEQIRSLRDKIGPATDVYGLCVLIFKMLAGVLPFQSKNLIDLLNQVMLKPPPMLGKYRPELAGTGLERLLFVGMAKNPANRIQPTEAFYTQFRQAIEQDPVLAPVLAAEAKDLQMQSRLETELDLPPTLGDTSEQHAFSPGDTARLVSEEVPDFSPGQTFVFGGATYSFDGEAIRTSSVDAAQWEGLFPDGNTVDAQAILGTDERAAAQLVQEKIEELASSGDTTMLDHNGVQLAPPPGGLPPYMMESADTIQAGESLVQAALQFGSVEEVLEQLPTVVEGAHLDLPPHKVRELVAELSGEADTRVSLHRSSMGLRSPEEEITMKTRVVRILVGFLIGFGLIGLGVWGQRWWGGSGRACCTLVIQSTPPRAEVIEQGRVLGVTPLEVKRKKGKGLQFVLRKRKHELATGAWKALQNESMSFRLEPHK